MVKGVLYTTGGTRRSVVALDAKTGELIWAHSLREGKRAGVSPRQLSGRGVSYWTDGRGDERILYVTTGYRLVALNAKTGALISRFGKDGIVDLKDGAVFGNGQPIDLETGEIGLHSTPADRQGRGDRRLVVPRRRDRRDAQQHQGAGARVRRAHRQAAVDVQHDSAARRVRQRDLGERFVGGQRQHRRVDADHRRRGARPRLSAGRDADVGLLRRPSARQQPVRRKPGLRRSKTGQRKWHFQLVHHPLWNYDMSSAPILARHHRQRPRDQGGGGRRASRRCSTSSIASPASRCGRSKSGRCRSPTCRARRRRRRSRSRPSRRPTRATT